MSIATNELKDMLKLGTVSQKFYDFLCDYYQFAPHHDTTFIKSQLEPWFGKPEERLDEFDDVDVHTQYYAELVQQKYRLALEFCAVEAGFENVVLYDPDNGRPVSGGMFWLRDCHPQPIYWHMAIRDKIVTRGAEEPGTLNIDTMEDWLMDRILNLVSIRKELENGEE